VNGSSASRPGHHQDQFSAELIELMSGPMARRIRAEVELARVKKISRRVQAAPGEQAKGFGGVLAVYGAGYLAACAFIAVGGVMTPWLDALIVGLGLLAAAGLLLLRQHRA
jgi:Putative Actinobacterial Holin-X, holin superfamily III